MSLRPAVALLALLLAVSASAVGGVAAQTGTQATETAPIEETTIEIQLEADGDAVWRVTERVAITDEAERAAFDDLGESFESGAASPLGLDTIRTAAETASSDADRTMGIQNVERTASRENGTLGNGSVLNGTYTLSFTWTNFAREDGENYVVDDVFVTDGETWFGGLTADERLIIALPSGHGASTAPKAFQQNELRWEGPTSFEPGYLRIVYSGTLPPPNPEGGLSLAWAALFVAVVASFGAGALLVRRRSGSPLARIRDAVGVGSADGAAEAEESEDATDDGDDDEDLELLSDEERVERLLEENGGRMKQANIVKETGWSNAKVSQLLSSMEDEDRIAKLRIGRENLISFPDEDVGDFDQ